MCLTQVVGWGVLYYAFPVALAAIAADTDWSETFATTAFSTGLLVSAVAGIPVGRLLDRHGPRLVLAAALVVLTIPAHALLLTPRWAPGRGTRSARADPGVGTVVRSGGFLLLCARLTLTGFALHAAGRP